MSDAKEKRCHKLDTRPHAMICDEMTIDNSHGVRLSIRALPRVEPAEPQKNGQAIDDARQEHGRPSLPGRATALANRVGHGSSRRRRHSSSSSGGSQTIPETVRVATAAVKRTLVAVGWKLDRQVFNVAGDATSTAPAPSSLLGPSETQPPLAVTPTSMPFPAET
ncbi:hypothetical protein BDK51DRAFT_41276 [Blyttiomyces helicus]|uniref:Uncharacterized protein n=1 Tax=Blyttiomyces helicus TaxID=388810 RepID=A0A4P9WI03_9FUNG|nr:hypothetical protein BDK51DRAFT_41276 [Blyttiomyces helicus]|eukprot:RKO90750.1 hypothetical protein BDK51DRAFT_41276 [Blyttiomyces helicus]